MPLPRTPKGMKSFEAFCSFYRQFIPNFSNVVKPIHDASLQMHVEITPEIEESFETMKSLMTSQQVLAHFDPKLKTFLRTDASGYGYGAVLEQEQTNGERRPVRFWSRIPASTEVNEGAWLKELFAMAYAIFGMTTYLEGIFFTVLSDNCALCYLKTKTHLTRKIAKIALALQEYDFKIEHRKGSQMGDADCLSRAPLQIPTDAEEMDRMFAFYFDDQANIIREEQLKQVDVAEKINKLLRDPNSLPGYLFENGILYRMRNTKKLVFVPTS